MQIIYIYNKVYGVTSEPTQSSSRCMSFFKDF